MLGSVGYRIFGLVRLGLVALGSIKLVLVR